MDHELSRVGRLIELRERERTTEVKEFQRTQAEEQAASLVEQAALQQLLEAEARRNQLAQTPTQVSDYLSQEDWIETLALRHAAARQRLVQVRGALRRAGVRVKGAQMRLKQVELLRERLVRARQEVQQRIERRAEDEIAQRVAASWRKE
jgi:flagellar export protein FliJ